MSSELPARSNSVLISIIEYANITRDNVIINTLKVIQTGS